MFGSLIAVRRNGKRVDHMKRIEALGRVDAAVILGSGLSESFGDDELELYDDGESSGVEGHRGQLCIWRSSGRVVLIARGRRHAYEGVGAHALMRTVDLAASHGARQIVVTNAAGGLHSRLRVGDIMLITGLNTLLVAKHMPLLQIDTAHGAEPADSNALAIDDDTDGPDAPSADDRTHSTPLRSHREIIARALARGLALEQGIYAVVSGPSYETRAEIRMLRRMGADAVGMSTLPEYIAAARHNIHVTGLSLITNTLSDTTRITLDHSEVVDAGARARHAMRIAIESALES